MLIAQDEVKFAALQFQSKDALNKTDRDENVDRAIEMIRNLDSKVDLVVTPELFTIGYSKEAFEALDETAETKNGETVEKFKALA